jgi:hypothetical protein
MMNKFKLITKETPVKEILDFRDYDFTRNPSVYELTRDRYFELINDNIRVNFTNKMMRLHLTDREAFIQMMNRCNCNANTIFRDSIDEHIRIYNDLVDRKIIQPFKD